MRRQRNGYLAIKDISDGEGTDVMMTDGADRAGRRLLVVGIDGTDAGVAALAWAAGQARGSGARVLAVAVCVPPPVVAGGPEVGGAAIAQSMLGGEELTAAAEAWLTEAITALPAEARPIVERQVAHGDAATALLDAAQEAELLVLGNHRRGAITSALVGSVAQSCAHHAECPLVLVPGPGDSSAEAPEPEDRR